MFFSSFYVFSQGSPGLLRREAAAAYALAAMFAVLALASRSGSAAPDA
jgi:hypothetical protein